MAKGKTKSAKALTSRALSAALAFLALNFAIPGFTQITKDSGKKTISGDLIQRSLNDAVSTLQASRRDLKGDPVVLIGSSLVMAPIWSADVAHGHCFKDCLSHHLSQHLADKMFADGVNKDAISLATPGQFVSDTYLIVDKYLKDNTKADILIYGVAPRDFMDDTTGGLALTSVFDKLVSLADLPKVSKLFFNTFDERADFILNRSIFLYKKRGRYQNKFQDSVVRATDKVLGPGKETIADKPSDDMVGFLMGGDHDQIWKKSISEYKQRYKYFNAQQFEKQQECFKSLLGLCKERNIKLYVLAMPLTTDNLNLMPPELYTKYISFVQSATTAQGFTFVNLQSKGGYTDQDFYDTVHLNNQGGERFLSQMDNLVLADKHGLAYNDSILELKPEAKQLAGKPVKSGKPANPAM